MNRIERIISLETNINEIKIKLADTRDEWARQESALINGVRQRVTSFNMGEMTEVELLNSLVAFNES